MSWLELDREATTKARGAAHGGWTLTRIRLEFVADEGVQSVDSQRRCLERVSVRDDVVRLYADG